MNDLRKSDFICGICNKILKEPIHLPCFCTICNEHLSDNTVKDGLIKCEPCGDDFVVKDIKIKENKLSKKVLAAENHLTNQEKAAKKEIHEQINKFQKLFEQLKNDTKNFEINCHEHFAEIQRQIDLQREELKATIDEIAMELINQTKETEDIYRQKQKEIQNIREFDIEMEKQDVENHFRKVD